MAAQFIQGKKYCEDEQPRINPRILLCKQKSVAMYGEAKYLPLKDIFICREMRMKHKSAWQVRHIVRPFFPLCARIFFSAEKSTRLYISASCVCGKI